VTKGGMTIDSLEKHQDFYIQHQHIERSNEAVESSMKEQHDAYL